MTTFMKTYLLNWKRFITLVVLTLSLQACQEEEDVLVEQEPDSAIAAAATPAELTLDSLFLYAKEVYLWNEGLPEYSAFSPRTYAGNANELEGLKKELFDICQYTLNPETGRAYEYVSSSADYPKYSFIEEQEDTNGTLSREGLSGMSDLEGTAEDFGIALSSLSATDLRIRYVTTGSPADKAGLTRGDRVQKINDQSVRLDSQADVDRILASLEKPTIQLSVKKTNGTVVEASLEKAAYTINPVFKSKVLKAGASTVGYLAYSMFSNMNNSQAALEKAFAAFAEAGVSDLVVDLRYNGGGYVATAEYLCNQIAPASLTNNVMYKEIYNALMQQGKAAILENKVLLDENDAPIPYKGRYFTYADFDYSEQGNTHMFRDEGALETVQRVYFIIGSGTASSSELVINALKPHLQVSLIGTTSFGKPVGFFGIDIDKYTVYMPNFKTVNAAGEGDYYGGFTPDVPAEDDVTHDFGDPQEASFAKALSLIQGGAARSAGSSANGGSDVAAQEKTLHHFGDNSGVQGMIENRKPGSF